MVRALTLFRSPVLTNFLLEPQQDVRVSKISSLTPSQHPSHPKAVGVSAQWQDYLACVRLQLPVPQKQTPHPHPQRQCDPAKVPVHRLTPMLELACAFPGRQQPHLSCSLVLCPKLLSSSAPASISAHTLSLGGLGPSGQISFFLYCSTCHPE